MAFKPDQELQKFLDEDLGNGDITSKLLEKRKITAKIITKQETVVAGVNFVKQIFSLKKCRATIIKKNGAKVKPNQVILEIRGDASNVLSCERTALNLLSRMCGIATKTNQLNALLKKTNS